MNEYLWRSHAASVRFLRNRGIENYRTFYENSGKKNKQPSQVQRYQFTLKVGDSIPKVK